MSGWLLLLALLANLGLAIYALSTWLDDLICWLTPRLARWAAARSEVPEAWR